MRCNMKHLILFILIVGLIVSSCSDSENPVEPKDDVLKKEAVNFSLNVVNCYFTQDTIAYRNYLPELLYMVDPEEPPYETSYFILSHYLSSYNYSEYNLEHYKDIYDYEILDYQEYAGDAASWLESLKYWHPNKDDYLFFGHNPREDKIPFMHYKPLIFFVTKSTGEWKIRAMQ